MSSKQTRPTDDIEPMIPILPTTTPTRTTRRRRTPTRSERPTDTTYAAESTRDYEEIAPGVPRMR